MSTTLLDVLDHTTDVPVTMTFNMTGGRDNISDSINMNTSSGVSTEDNDYTDPLEWTKEAIVSIQYGLLPFLVVTGLLGNTLTIVAVASRQLSHMASRYILIFLAISDTVMLLTQPFNKLWTISLFGRDLRAISDTTCKAFFVIYRSAKMTSSWLVVLLCFERFVAVIFPLKAKLILRERVVFLAIVVNYLSMLTYNSVWSVSSKVVNGICKPNVPSLRNKVLAIVGITFYSILPLVLLLVFTPQIIFKLHKQMRFRQALSVNSSTGQGSNKAKEDMIRASFMVLGVMVSYIVLIIPITIVQLITFAKGVEYFENTNYSFFVFKEIAQMLEQVNYAANFFFYTMCSASFRERVRYIICFSGFRSSIKSNGEHSNATPIAKPHPIDNNK